MKRKRRLITGALFLAAVLLVAWKVKPVELIDDKLLIDLDTAIVEAGWGQEGNPSDNPDDPKQDGEQEEDKENTGTTQKPNPDQKAITVSVKGEKIIMDGGIMEDVVALQSQLTVALGKNATVVLEDNYAEAHVYKDVLKLLQDMQAREQFVLSEVVK